MRGKERRREGEERRGSRREGGKKRDRKRGRWKRGDMLCCTEVSYLHQICVSLMCFCVSTLCWSCVSALS